MDSEWHSFTSGVVILSNYFLKSNVSVSVVRSFCHYGNFDYLHQHKLNVFIEKIEDFWKNKSKTYDYKKNAQPKRENQQSLVKSKFLPNIKPNVDQTYFKTLRSKP